MRARSLFARIQQFANRLYGPMFAAGMHYWQLGDSPYWGHNAILRVDAFMRHCGLPRLSGRPPFGGDILSHDFVEAALLGRAGFSIWLAFDLPSSYEETPGSLLEEMQRDQRWCQGNLQHLRLLFTEGLSSAHRALFLNGVFSYVSAVLWLGFLAASTVEAVMWVIRGPDYFAAGATLFPTWPVWRPERAGALFAVVFGVLLLPKLLAVVLELARGSAAAFGGIWTMLRGVFLESLATALFAPIRMAFYCRFVVLNLLGRSVVWRGGADELGETSWREALRRHGADTLVACVWALGVHWLHPAAFWWLAPVAGALVLSGPRLGPGQSRESGRPRPREGLAPHPRGEGSAPGAAGSGVRPGRPADRGERPLAGLRGGRGRPTAQRDPHGAAARTPLRRPGNPGGAASPRRARPDRGTRRPRRSGEATRALGRRRPPRPPYPGVASRGPRGRETLGTHPGAGLGLRDLRAAPCRMTCARAS